MMGSKQRQLAQLIHVSLEELVPVDHPLKRGLSGLPKMKPQPVEKTSAMLVRGIEHRSRTIIVPAAHLARLTPDLLQLAVERMARRHKWANAIQKKVEQGGAGNEQ